MPILDDLPVSFDDRRFCAGGSACYSSEQEDPNGVIKVRQVSTGSSPRLTTRDFFVVSSPTIDGNIWQYVGWFLISSGNLT